jgi:hypothetical protein
MDKNVTAQELAQQAHAARPEVIYQAASDGNSVAAWHEGRWIPVAGKLITGGWHELPYELLVNGKPAFDPAIYGPAPKEA